MPTPGEHKTVQARIFEYAEAIHLRQGYGGQVGFKSHEWPRAFLHIIAMLNMK